MCLSSIMNVALITLLIGKHYPLANVAECFCYVDRDNNNEI